ncbi:Methylsterol monooxygenase [Neolecta irregularis DAH-3]|uniref:Methylsterol monooxygenase n=1 Tax=Neolecta irregularis (strain DAH-3) TaxID=1198029 RepID=A0A1U7LPK7_NEOID|nr:Methylsterol monooxygenase [Neolecta irregularis DAH-3]|eukprot:OLL24584.1 Methylsterol monooxygenase [Neolecta irregularis DAH-3]
MYAFHLPLRLITRASFSNYTVRADGFLSTLNQVKHTAPLLSSLEALWMAYYKWMDNDVLATGILSFVIHQLLYFGRALPWYIIDHLPYFNKWKIQDQKLPSAQDLRDCVTYVLFTHFTVEVAQIWLFHPLCEHFGLRISPPFPKWQEMLPQLAIFFIMEDTFHYFAHRLLHYGPFYKYIHKRHHRFSAPFGLAAEYAHPIEVIVLGLGTVGSPILYTAITGNLHLVTVYAWIALRLFQAIDAHSGYDFPWSLNKFIPFWSGAEHHDYHHQNSNNCYSTSFRWWDYICGTDKKYRAHRQLQAIKKLTNKAE